MSLNYLRDFGNCFFQTAAFLCNNGGFSVTSQCKKSEQKSGSIRLVYKYGRKPAEVVKKLYVVGESIGHIVYLISCKVMETLREDRQTMAKYS